MLQVRWTGISLYETCRSIPRFRTPGILGFLAFQGKMEEDLIYIWMITENVSEMDPISIIVLDIFSFIIRGYYLLGVGGDVKCDVAAYETCMCIICSGLESKVFSLRPSIA